MNRVDTLRNNIIDKLLTISDGDYLAAIFRLINNNPKEEDIVKLSDEQKLMLQLSEKDIENNNFIPQNELDKADLKWLKEL